MIKKEKIEDGAIKIYTFLFILMLFNREFIPFKVDFRYIQIIIGIYLLISKFIFIVINKDYSLLKNKKLIWITIFYLYIFIVNIRWVNNGLTLNLQEFVKMIILDFNNLMAILIFYLYSYKIDKKYIVDCIVISGVILIISMFLVWIGYTLPQIMGGDYLGYYPGPENLNLFGQEFRIAGYAQDPNYASIFMTILFFTAMYFIENKKLKFLIVGIALMGYALSLSRTITIGIIFSCIYILFLKFIKSKNDSIGNKTLVIFVILIVLLPYISVKLFGVVGNIFSMDTMNTRLYMWENAAKLFENNILFGNGITSFRSYFSTQYMGWYVHPHSTIFQLLCETGVIGAILFIIIMIYSLIESNNYMKFNIIIFLIFCLTSELTHLSLFAFIIGLLPILNNNYEEKKKE